MVEHSTDNRATIVRIYHLEPKMGDFNYKNIWLFSFLFFIGMGTIGIILGGVLFDRLMLGILLPIGVVCFSAGVVGSLMVKLNQLEKKEE